MSPRIEDIKSLPVSEKAELYRLLQDDKELKDYFASNDKMFEELALRDQAYEEGKIGITTRQQLTDRLKSRRNAL